VFWLIEIVLAHKGKLAVLAHEHQQSSRFKRSDSFFNMLRLISCMAGRSTRATPGIRFGFRDATSMAEWLLLFVVEFMMKSRCFLNDGF
jgi:hypothetical protein